MTSVRQLTHMTGLLALGTAAFALPTHADIKIVQSTAIDNPQLTAMMQSMSAQQKASLAKSGLGVMIGEPLVTTSYVSGNKVRSDIGPTTIILNTTTHQMTTLNRLRSTYNTQIYNPPNDGTGPTATVKDTGQVKTILGHPAHHYTLSIVTKSTGQNISGDIWAATDLPQLPQMGMSSGPMAGIQTAMHKIKGTPLLISMVISGGPAGNTKAKSTVKSISTAPIPAALFAIPKGYKPGPPGSGGLFPGGGMPSGGGRF